MKFEETEYGKRVVAVMDEDRDFIKYIESTCHNPTTEVLTDMIKHMRLMVTLKSIHEELRNIKCSYCRTEVIKT